METSQAQVSEAGLILRPALLLWLATWLLTGACNQVYILLHPLNSDGSWVAPSAESDAAWSIAPRILALILIAWFCWRDARFDAPPPRMAEMCLILIIGGGLILHMWASLVTGNSVGYFPELEAGFPMWATLVSTALLPAIAEELMYRGLLLDRFRRVMPLQLAICIQAMMFSVMHQVEMMILPLFAVGVLTGVMRVAAGALWPCMLFHLLWNGYSVLTAYKVL